VGTDAAPGDVLRTPEAGARVIRGGTLRGGGYVVGTLLAVATSVVLLRELGVDDFGRYAAVVALVGIVSTVTDAGLTAIGARELALRPRGVEREGLLRQLIALRVLLTAAGVLLATAVAALLGYDRTMVLGTLLAGIGVLLVNTQATAMMPLSVELRLGWVTTVEVLRQALTLAGVILLALVGATLLPYFAVQILVGMGVLALTPALLGSASALRPSLDRAQAGFLLREALPVAIALAMNVVYLRLLVVLVSVVDVDVLVVLVSVVDVDVVVVLVSVVDVDELELLVLELVELLVLVVVVVLVVVASVVVLVVVVASVVVVLVDVVGAVEEVVLDDVVVGGAVVDVVDETAGQAASAAVLHTSL